MVYEIVILAMIAAFLGLRLYSVLGRRAEHEEEPVPTRFDQPEKGSTPRVPPPPGQAGQFPFRQREAGNLPLGTEEGLRAIAAVDRRFELGMFLDGARAAYGMILEAFWNGDKEQLAQLCDSDVYEHFSQAIDARNKAGEVLDNRLVRIERSIIRSAQLDGRTARIAVLFDADIATVVRDRDGTAIAGSLDDAVESHDVWTFSRDVTSAAPDWVLDETDEG